MDIFIKLYLVLDYSLLNHKLVRNFYQQVLKQISISLSCEEIFLKALG